MTVIGHTGWRVVSIDPSAYQVAANGDPIYGYRVRFETGAGNKGTVFLREQDFVPANVGAAIDVRAAVMDSVAMMESPATITEV